MKKPPYIQEVTGRRMQQAGPDLKYKICRSETGQVFYKKIRK